MKVIMKKPVWFYSSYSLEKMYLSWRYGEKFYDVEESNYTKTDKIALGILDLWFKVALQPLNYLSRLKRKIFKPIRVRIDSWDVWSADHTLALIIAPMLRQLKKDKQGSPHVDDEDVPEHLRRANAPPAEEYHTDDLWHDRWEWVLDEMIWVFENIQTDWEEKYYSGEIDHYFEKQESGLYSMEHGPNHTFKIDTEGMKVEQERMNNALRLFGKYYFCLWD